MYVRWESVFLWLFGLVRAELYVLYCGFVVEFPSAARAKNSRVFFHNLILNLLPSSLFQKIPQYLTLIFPFRLRLLLFSLPLRLFTLSRFILQQLGLLVNDLNFKWLPFLLEDLLTDALMLHQSLLFEFPAADPALYKLYFLELGEFLRFLGFQGWDWFLLGFGLRLGPFGLGDRGFRGLGLV